VLLAPISEHTRTLLQFGLDPLTASVVLHRATLSSRASELALFWLILGSCFAAAAGNLKYFMK
jgi:hypothetical protein